MAHIEIKSVTIVRTRNTTDLLRFHTELPLGIWPYEGTSVLSMEVGVGNGEEYVKENLPGVPYEVVDAR